MQESDTYLMILDERREKLDTGTRRYQGTLP
jgi:hypothetical protein